MKNSLLDLFEIEDEKKEVVEINDNGELISVSEAEDIGKRIIDYFATFEDVTDYYVERKKEKLKEYRPVMDETGEMSFAQSNKLFNDFNMEPKDFDIDVTLVETANDNRIWKDLSQITATFPIEEMPGRNVKFLVKEKTTDTILGVLRIGSPTLNMKPRNTIFGEYLEPEFVNSSCVNGTVIVSAQPFGYNLLGGKLCALLCCSNEVRNIIESKYDMKIRLFETTSLYGSIKGVSQYDGLKPFIRYGGDTESKFPMNLSDELHHEIKSIFDKKDPKFSDIKTGSVKLKIYMKIIGIVKRVLKNGNSPFYDEFMKGLKHSESLTTQKRYYYCDYGVQNIDNVIRKGEDIKYKDGMSYDRFNKDNIVEWWKKKAQKRFEKLRDNGQLRQELEFWTLDKLKNKEIDIIR